MASAMRLSSAFRATARAPAFTARRTAFNGMRCYSAKTQVGNIELAQFRMFRDLLTLPLPWLDPEGALRRASAREDRGDQVSAQVSYPVKTATRTANKA